MAAGATTFFFRAVASDGRVRQGSLTGDSERSVARELMRQGLTPVYVGLEQNSSGFEWKIPGLGGSRKDVLFFTQEISTLLTSGIPLDKALGIAVELTERPRFRQVIADVLQSLKGGKSFADCLAQHPKAFSDLYVNMVRAGEASGSLAPVFERLVEFEKTRDELRGYVISSLIYPALLSIVGATSIFILMYFVVPRFAQIFTEGRMEMPVPTRILITVSNFVRAYGLFAVGALAAALVAFNVWIRGEGRTWWDTTRLKIPLLGIALRKAETARFARAMGTLVSNTVPLVQSLGIASKILNNRVMAASLDTVAQAVKRGEGLATPLKRTGQFPALAGHLLMVGEETGKLDVMFHRMADIYEEETKDAIKRFTTLFEPLIIFIMGIVIGSLILSMLLAIASINDVAM